MWCKFRVQRGLAQIGRALWTVSVSSHRPALLTCQKNPPVTFHQGRFVFFAAGLSLALSLGRYQPELRAQSQSLPLLQPSLTLPAGAKTLLRPYSSYHITMNNIEAALPVVQRMHLLLACQGVRHVSSFLPPFVALFLSLCESSLRNRLHYTLKIAITLNLRAIKVFQACLQWFFSRQETAPPAQLQTHVFP
jgi:hypothetical protein